MGVNAIELVMRIEDTFGIQLGRDPQRLTSVGDLYYNILRELDIRNERYSSFTVFAFFRFRKSLHQLTGVPKSQIRLDTPLKNVISLRGRRRLWSALSQDSNLRLPDLRMAIPRTLILVAAPVLGFALAVAFPFLDYKFLWNSSSIDTIGIYAIMGFSAVIGLTAPALCRVKFPAGCTDVHGLISAVRSEEYKYLTRGSALLTSGEVWSQLRSLIATAAKVKPECVTPDALLIEDIGVG